LGHEAEQIRQRVAADLKRYAEDSRAAEAKEGDHPAPIATILFLIGCISSLTPAAQACRELLTFEKLMTGFCRCDGNRIGPQTAVLLST
jgi:hypothetical protein